MSTKITSFEIENVKRVKAVALAPSENGLTVIGGRNGQGKTSVLDAIAWALGGDKYRPSGAHREGSVLPPSLRIELSNGLIVERKGKNSDLKVIDPQGNRAGQTLLNEFIEQLALDLPKFMAATAKEKANTLLRIIGVGEQLYQLEQQEQTLYNQRHAIGQIADQKKKFALELPDYPDAPRELVSASELIKQQQDILARNGENQRKRDHLNALTTQYNQLRSEIAELYERLHEKESRRDELFADITIAKTDSEQLVDQSTVELEQNIADIEQINIRVRANLDKEKAEEDAKDYQAKYDAMTDQITSLRDQRMALLRGADLPLPGLSVEDGELTYNGAKWDCMSGADQLRVATAIVRRLNPKCGFVLIDKLEQMDTVTLQEFAAWLEGEGLQAIATRVSLGEECAVIIEDGAVMQTAAAEKTPVMPEVPAGGYWS